MAFWRFWPLEEPTISRSSAASASRSTWLMRSRTDSAPIAAPEVHAEAVLVTETVLHLAEKLLIVHDLARLQSLELFPRPPGELYLLVQRTLDVRNRLFGLFVDLLYCFLTVLFRDVGKLFGELVRGRLALYDALALGAEALRSGDFPRLGLLRAAGSPARPARAGCLCRSHRSSRSTQVTMEEAKYSTRSRSFGLMSSR